MIRKIHRYLGLAAALFWLIQALTGVVLVFQWEMDDATLAAPTVPVDPAALGASMDAIGQQHGRVASLWASGESSGRFDIYYEDRTGAARVMRVDGAGRILRDRSDTAVISGGALFGTLSNLHQTLLSGELGSWIVGISGILLCTNVCFGLKLLWPHKGQWRRVLFARIFGPVTARRSGLHRMLGAWIALPMLLIAGTGTLLVFTDGLERLLHARLSMPLPDAPARPPQSFGVAGKPTGPAEALILALNKYPGSNVSALVLPDADHPWLRVRLRTNADLPRVWGATPVFVTVAGGQVIDEQGARESVARRLMDALYPLHTGQMGGIAGRIALLLVGASFFWLVWIGVTLWQTRWLEARNRGGAATAPPAAPLASVQPEVRRSIVERGP